MEIKKNKKFNILFVSHECNYFVDNNASFFRMHQNLSYFHRHKDFNVVVLQPDDEKEKENPFLKSNIISYYYKNLTLFGNKFVHFNDFNPYFIIKIYQILKKHHFDLIHVDFIYGLNILRFLTKTPVCYNAHNVEAIYYDKIGRYYYKLPFFLRSLYVKYIYFLENYAVRYAKSINALSYNDKDLFLRLYNIPEKKIIVCSMGYNEKIFNCRTTVEEARGKLRIEKNKFVVIFHGFYYKNYANREAIDIIINRIAPKIKEDEILFLIAGHMPSFKNTRNIRFLGFVKDLNSFLYAADLAVTPILRGSGVRVKMIDYLSAKLPIISTKEAILGLKFKNGVHGYVVDPKKPIKSMIEKIIEIKKNPRVLEKFKKNIEILLKSSYDWNSINKTLEKRYRKILNELP